MTNSLLNRSRGALLGLACGDAVGTTLEFQKLEERTPINDMVGGGYFNLKKGEWTDDTSMALCLAESLLVKKGFDAKDQMDRYCRWKNEGYMSSTGKCFDIGNTVLRALLKYEKSGDPFSGSTDSNAAGNGSIMRLVPIPIFYNESRADVLKYSIESSRTTHGCQECLECCQVLGEMLYLALNGSSKEEILKVKVSATMPRVESIINGDYKMKSSHQLTGTGYVIDTLETALWCYWKTSSFKEAVLLAVNMSVDADTVAAVCGQLAGAFYGYEGIPKEWLQVLKMKLELDTLAVGFVNKD